MNTLQTLSQLVEANNQQDNIKFANQFTESAVVTDEGNTYNGRNEISTWINEAYRKYEMNLSPKNIFIEGPKMIMGALISGHFEGSPLMLYYHITMEGSKIATLHISGKQF